MIPIPSVMIHVEPEDTPNTVYWDVFWYRFKIWWFGGVFSDGSTYTITLWSVHDIARRCMNVRKGEIKRG